MKRQRPFISRNHWDSPIRGYSQLTSDACKLIFEQPKTYFEETVQESEELTQRSQRMLFLLLPAIAAVVAYCVSSKDKFKPLDSIGLLLLLMSIGAAVYCGFNLFMLISPKNMHYRGSKPEDVMRSEIFAITDPKVVEKALYISEIERCQIKIEQIEQWNRERIHLYINVIISFNIALTMGTILFVKAMFI